MIRIRFEVSFREGAKVSFRTRDGFGTVYFALQTPRIATPQNKQSRSDTHAPFYLHGVYDCVSPSLTESEYGRISNEEKNI